jgi:hypothetical protein
MPESTERVVKVFWADRSGKKSDAYQATLGHTIDQVSNSATGDFHTALWYSVKQTGKENVLVDPTLGISKIWFTVTDKNSTKTYDQDGTGFAVQDMLLMGNASFLSGNPTCDEGNFKMEVAVSGMEC